MSTPRVSIYHAFALWGILYQTCGQREREERERETVREEIQKNGGIDGGERGRRERKSVCASVDVRHVRRAISYWRIISKNGGQESLERIDAFQSAFGF